MDKNKKLLAIGIGIPLVAVAWVLFRPELLFVNQKVNETLPVGIGSASSAMSMILASGTFSSQAHETKGTAEVAETNGKNFLQLRDFTTSNGPDVHIYLVKGDSADAGKVLGSGFIDLGPIKGNIGNQAYEIPTGTNLDEYGAVSVWCKRFNVGFGGAILAKASKDTKTAFQPTAGWRLAGFDPTIEVTFGNVMGDKRFSGRVALVEKDGKRYASVNFKNAPSGFSLRLVKKETLKTGDFPKDVKFVDLGKLTTKPALVPISKDLDIWLYRTIAVMDGKSGRIVSYVNLRSAQEGKSGVTFI